MMVGFGFGYDGWLLELFHFILQQELLLLHLVYQNMHGGRLILHWWCGIFFVLGDDSPGFATLSYPTILYSIAYLGIFCLVPLSKGRYFFFRLLIRVAFLDLNHILYDVNSLM
jgi:hypothetical protein